jgi:acetyl-CoA carboxylase biotin carboxyl carrier protein
MPSNPSGGRTPAQRQSDHASLTRLSDTLVPALVQKLASSGLGELEVREGEWRIRLRRPITPAPPPTRRGDRPRLGAHADRDGRPARDATTAGQRGLPASDPAFDGRLAAGDLMAEAPARATATSPAVGVFRPGPGLGTVVRAGDPIGVVDLLGIPQDVPAPIDGTLIEVLPAPGEAVEYGEAIATVEAAPATPAPAIDGSSASSAGDPPTTAPPTPATARSSDAAADGGAPEPDAAAGERDPEPGAPSADPGPGTGAEGRP